MKQSNSTSIQDFKITMGGFIIAAGLLSIMFHMILFPIIAVFVGIPWLAFGIYSAAVNMLSRPRVCSPEYAWQESCR